MKYFQTPQGNLCLQAETADSDMLSDLCERVGHHDTDFLSELFDQTGWAPNGKLMLVNPLDVGALTDSPIVTDDRTVENDGSVSVSGNVWWFPDYAVASLPELLRKNGQVVLQRAP